MILVEEMYIGIAEMQRLGKDSPDEQEGKEGDEQIRFISSLGLYLFKKYKNEWYGVAMSKMSALKKL